MCPTNAGESSVFLFTQAFKRYKKLQKWMVQSHAIKTSQCWPESNSISRTRNSSYACILQCSIWMTIDPFHFTALCFPLVSIFVLVTFLLFNFSVWAFIAFISLYYFYSFFDHHGGFFASCPSWFCLRVRHSSAGLLHAGKAQVLCCACVCILIPYSRIRHL